MAGRAQLRMPGCTCPERSHPLLTMPQLAAQRAEFEAQLEALELRHLAELEAVQEGSLLSEVLLGGFGFICSEGPDLIASLQTVLWGGSWAFGTLQLAVAAPMTCAFCGKGVALTSHCVPCANRAPAYQLLLPPEAVRRRSWLRGFAP